MPVNNWIPGIELETPDMHIWSTCLFDREKKAWIDVIGDVPEDDVEPRARRASAFLRDNYREDCEEATSCSVPAQKLELRSRSESWKKRPSKYNYLIVSPLSQGHSSLLKLEIKILFPTHQKTIAASILLSLTIVYPTIVN